MLAESTILKDYPLHKGLHKISRTLLWDCDYDRYDFISGRSLAVERVVSMGRAEDFYAAFDLYGGFDGFRKSIRDDVRHLEPIDINFVCLYFDLKKEELKCYKITQSRQKLLNS